ncbi:MAG TPA: inorganic diphosphatase [Myxococcota bacterium]|nr:inorganic diphosphatase [Myxococcota bacterium]
MVQVRIEVSRGSFLKREGERVEYVSPVPCPFNYGCIEGELAEDGDPPDVILLGPACPRGSLQEAPLVGRVLFRDAGCADPKWVAGHRPPSVVERRAVETFFRVYAPLRRLLNLLQRKQGETRYLGVEWY